MQALGRVMGAKHLLDQLENTPAAGAPEARLAFLYWVLHLAHGTPTARAARDALAHLPTDPQTAAGRAFAAYLQMATKPGFAAPSQRRRAKRLQ